MGRRGPAQREYALLVNRTGVRLSEPQAGYQASGCLRLETIVTRTKAVASELRFLNRFRRTMEARRRAAFTVPIEQSPPWLLATGTVDCTYQQAQLRVPTMVSQGDFNPESSGLVGGVAGGCVIGSVEGIAP